MRRVALSLTLLLLLLLGAVPARAETDGPRIANMKVSVWPEYDEPRTLVMYEGTLPSTGNFPQDVRFRVPKGAEITQACAIKKPDDEHLCQLYETQAEGDWLIVSYKLPLPDFFLEFYYNPVSGTGQRDLDFSFLPALSADSLQLEVQQPLRSTDFVVNPPTDSVQTDQQGFKYYHYDFKDVPADKAIAVKLSYSKADARPSVNKPPQQGAEGTGGTGDDPSRFLWLIVGVAMVGAFAAIMARQWRRGAAAPAPKVAWQAAGAGRMPTGRAPTAPARRSAFCTQCGSAVRPGANFCAQCGARLTGAR